MTVSVKFCGAAGTVTGSCHLVAHPRGRVLVDCGLFQGPKTLRALNYGAFPFDPAGIDAAVLTHAHIDHSGLVPKLCATGFRGRVVATPATVDLLRWLLPDAGAIQEAEVERLNRRNARRGRPPVAPIYTRAGAEAALERFDPAPFERWIEAAPGVRARFWNAGHILGSASVELEVASGDPGQRFVRLLFSGDLGPGDKPFHKDPDAPENFDSIVMETTYGDRDRPELSDGQRRDLLRAEVQAALAAGGNLLIPAFAVERTQELLHDLVRLMADGALPRAPVFLDSPLAAHATAVFEQHLEGGGGHLFRAPNIKITADAADSAALSRIASGAIVIAGSGMCDAGRIRHHLRDNLWRPGATVLMVGYQAPGTLGALLLDGARAVRIHGEEVAVRARVRRLDAYSGHADRGGLLAWLRARLPARGVFLVHGEEPALAAMKEAAVGLGLAPDAVAIPRLDQVYRLHPPTRGLHPAHAAGETTRLDPATAQAVRMGRDWHNEYAALQLAFQHRLQAAADARARAALLRRVRRAIEGA